MSNPLDNIAPQDFAQVSEAGAVADTDLLPILRDGQARKVSVGTLLAGASGGLPEGVSLELADSTALAPTIGTDAVVLGATDATLPVTLMRGDPTDVTDRSMVTVYPKTEASDSLVSLSATDDTNEADLDLDGTTGYVNVYVSAGINVSGLPTSDPGVEGDLFTDGAPSAGTPKALMVSGGAAP